MKKTVISLILAAAMLFAAGVTAFAEDTAIPEGEEFYKGYELFEYLLEFYLANHVFEPDKEAVLDFVTEYLLKNHPELVDEAIYYLMKSSDPYSYYYSAEEYAAYMSPTTYCGIGVTIEYGDGYIWITKTEEGSPAEKAGVLPGDMIFSVNGLKVAGMKYEDVTALIRSEEPAPITMEFYRPSDDGGYLYTADMTSKKLTVGTVNWHVGETKDGKKYGYVQVTSFKSYSTYFMYVEFLQTMVDLGIEDIIVDLRGNLGGSLYVCLDMINWLTPGKRLLGSIYTPATDVKEDYYATGRGLTFKSVSILVDGNSASASELFSKSLQDNKIATVIGTHTYGKAIGQTQVQQPDGSVVSLSMFEVLSPKGDRYNGIGVIPDIETSLPYTTPPDRSFEYLTFDNYTEARNYAENDTVYALEQRLVLLGYLETADRLFDSDTVSALWRFQERNGLSPTATLNRETLIKITDIVNLVKLCGDYIDPSMEKAVERISK